MSAREINSSVDNQQVMHRKLVFEFNVVHHATPASKKVASDLPGVCFISSEGLTTPVSAIEDVTGLTNYTAASDASGIVDVLLKGSELGSIKKVMTVVVREKVSTGFSAPTVQILGSAGGLTPGGNIAFEVTVAASLATTDSTCVVEVDYLLSE